MSNGKSASKSNPLGIRNTKKPIARRQRKVGQYTDPNLAKFLDKCRNRRVKILRKRNTHGFTNNTKIQEKVRT